MAIKMKLPKNMPLSALLSALAVGTLLFTPSPCSAEQRVFRSLKGQEIIAEIVSAKGDMVTLKKDDREMETSISIYSPEDQAYIRKWMEANPAAIDYALEIDASKKKIGRMSTPTGYYNRREGTWAYSITLENRSRDTAAGLKLEYRIFKESNVSDSGYPRRPNTVIEKKNSIDIPDLQTNRSAEITTDSFTLIEISYDGSYDYTDELIGILLRVVDSNGKVVAEFKGGTQAITEKKWEKKPTKASSVIIK